MTIAVHEMIVDHALRLHKGVDDGRTHKIGAAFAQILGDRDGNVRLRDDVLNRQFSFSLPSNSPTQDTRIARRREPPREAGTA